MNFRANRFWGDVCCPVSALALAASTLHAQLVADGAANTLSNITSDVTVDTNGALPANSITGHIGLNATK